MNSISMVQSNVDALPPPNADAAILAELPALKSPPLLSSLLSSRTNEPHAKRFANRLSRRSGKKTVTWLGDAMLSRWKSYRERLDECRSEPTAESVHELRVAIRRLISQFILVNQIFPGRGSEKARNILKRQLESLGDLRDTHVAQLFLRRQLIKFPDLVDLLARLERRERSLIKRASRKIARFKTKKLEKWVYSSSGLIERQSHSHRVPQHIRSIALQSANAALTDVVGRWRMIDRTDLGTIHRTRVAFKKFRYIVESLPPELTGFGKRDLRMLARYQRRMGNIQDFEVILACVISFMKRQENVQLDSFCGYLKSRRTRALRSFLQKSDRLLQLWPPGEPRERQISVVPSNSLNS
jgi:CHAD domain-containing protein